MKHIALLIMCVSTYVSALSQSTSPAVIISSGTFIKGEDASLSWTIGEILVESCPDDDLMLLQGFREIEDIVVDDDFFNDNEVWIYPTSTRAIVNVVFREETEGMGTCEIVDMSGKLLLTVKLPQCHNEINLEEFDYGVYLLRITLADKRVTEGKILKY